MPDKAPPPPPEEIVLYAKDPATKIATITLNRPGFLNAPTIAARQRYADLVHRANVDDDVKVLIVRGVGEHFGSGADLPEMAGMFNGDPDYSVLPEFGIDGRDTGDGDVKYPPRDSYRYIAQVTNLYANSSFGLRSLQDFKKISHHRGQGLLLRLAFLPGRRCRHRHRFRRFAVRPQRLPLCRLGGAAVAVGDDDGAAQFHGNGVHRQAVHRAGDERLQLRQFGGAARKP